MTRELLGPLAHEAGIEITNRASIIAELNYRLTEAPDFWKNARGGLDLIDDNVVLEVYEQAKKVREDWLKAQKEKGEAAKKALTKVEGKK
jgi:hypothetical protein